MKIKDILWMNWSGKNYVYTLEKCVSNPVLIMDCWLGKTICVQVNVLI